MSSGGHLCWVSWERWVLSATATRSRHLLRRGRLELLRNVYNLFQTTFSWDTRVTLGKSLQFFILKRSSQRRPAFLCPGATYRFGSSGLLASQQALRNTRRTQDPALVLPDRENQHRAGQSSCSHPGAAAALLPQDEVRETAFTV